MNDLFTSSFFAANRQRLRELFTGTAPIVVTANGLLQRGGDSSYPFKQDANFWYLTGIEEPDIILVIDREKEYLIVPTRSVVRQAFDGSVGVEELIARSGVGEVVDDKDGWEQLQNRLKKVLHVATIAPAPSFIEQYGLYTNPARANLVQRIKDAKPDIEFLDLALHLSRLRMIKQLPELQAIQTAIDITIASMNQALTPKKLATYEYEYEIEAELARGFRKRGALGHAFDPIVASGARAVTLHNVANSGQLASDELLVTDIGAEYQQYAADITRTYALSTASRRQQQVYNAVLEVQNYAMSLLKPGVLIREYELQIEQYMGEKLRELGLLKTIDHDAVREFYPHATSHFLGLNVHDAGDYDRPLESGVVLTVEPGIYIAREAIGIRIEDDVLITENGLEQLTSKLPRSL
jgi:Xaa-Pro aminopeptidase